MLFGIAVGLSVLCLIILVHELGHFAAAKVCGVKVEAFSLGFWKVLWSFSYHGTEYRLSVIPLGGYVLMKGETKTEGSDERICERDSYPGCGFARKVLILLAGPLANACLAYMCSILFLMLGSTIALPVVGSVDQGSIAAVAGVKTGDRIVKLEGTRIDTWNEFARMSLFAEGNRRLIVERNGTTVELTAAFPEKVDHTKLSEAIWKPMGLTQNGQQEWYQPGLVEALEKSFRFIGSASQVIVTSLWWLISGDIPLSNLNGPVMIVKVTGDIAALGRTVLLGFVAFLSLNVGLMNLLPVPVMDGGQIVLVTIEAIRRKAFSAKTIERLSWASLAALGCLTLFTLVNDIRLLLKM